MTNKKLSEELLTSSDQCKATAEALVADTVLTTSENSNVLKMDDFRPHTNTGITCPECGRKWIATHPSSCKKLECPGCHIMVSIEKRLTYYRGKGQHGVNALEAMIEERDELILDLRNIIQLYEKE